MNRLLPGLSRLAAGQPRGAALVATWLALLALSLWRWERIQAALLGGAADERLAVAALAGAVVLTWWLGNRAPGERGVGRWGSQWALARRRFRRHRGAMLGLGLMAALGLLTLLTPLVAPYDPDAIGDIVATRYLSPSAEHLMGTDKFGRDVFSRVLYGARISLSIGFLAVAIAITLGTLVGAVAGYAGGRLDAIMMRTVDLLLSFPRLVLLIAVVAVFDPSIALVTLVLGLTGWMGTSRIVRGQVLSVREAEYVQAARALGYRAPRIVGRHILPNVLTPVIVAATLGIGNTVLAEAALSFLGLGVPPPTASWGGMVAEGRDAILDAWWVTAFPGLAIVFTVMSFNLVGDGLRDALDPRSVA